MRHGQSQRHGTDQHLTHLLRRRHSRVVFPNGDCISPYPRSSPLLVLRSNESSQGPNIPPQRLSSALEFDGSTSMSRLPDALLWLARSPPRVAPIPQLRPGPCRKAWTSSGSNNGASEDSWYRQTKAPPRRPSQLRNADWGTLTGTTQHAADVPPGAVVSERCAGRTGPSASYNGRSPLSLPWEPSAVT